MIPRARRDTLRGEIDETRETITDLRSRTTQLHV